MKRTSPKSKKQILSLAALKAQVQRLKRLGKKIAMTNGCFDLLHVGHLAYLEKIKQKADVLVVALNSDSSVRKIKGKGRPILPGRERARLIAALKPVDYVTFFAEETPIKVVKAIQPHILAKGGDWKSSDIVGSPEVKATGGKVLRISYVKGKSTSQIIRKIRRR